METFSRIIPRPSTVGIFVGVTWLSHDLGYRSIDNANLIRIMVIRKSASTFTKRDTQFVNFNSLRRNNRIWCKGLVGKSSKVAFNQVILQTRLQKNFEKRLFSSTGRFTDWKLRTDTVYPQHVSFIAVRNILKWAESATEALWLCLQTALTIC